MNQKKKSAMGGFGVGGSSILAVFCVLCLTTFSTLSLITANADYKLAQKSAKTTALYYQTQGEVEEIIGQVITSLQTNGTGATQPLLDQYSALYSVVPEGGWLEFTYRTKEEGSRKMRVQVILPLGPNGRPTGQVQRIMEKEVSGKTQ